VKNHIFFKLLAAFLLVVAASTVVLDDTVSGAWETSLRAEIERNLTQKAVLFAHRVETDRTRALADVVSEEGQAAGARATVIDSAGKVLADSETDPANMENQGLLKEYQAALSGRIGVDERRSATVAILYVAAPISGGAVRLAYPLSDIEAVQSQVRRRLVFGAVLALLIAMSVAAIASISTSRRLDRIASTAAHIAQGDLHARVNDSSLDEIGRVGSAIDQTAAQVEHSLAAVRSSQRQLETLLNSMEDAVIAVGADGCVQWANQSMDRLVHEGARLNAPVVETVRDPDFLAAVKAATATKEVRTTRATSIVPGRAFDVTAAPLPGGGAVVVLRDLTETERVEKTRRDFIANVSHELRTPLTSIQGYAETLLDSTPENGAPTREFLEIIRKNAARMSRLTEDLLTLARVESGETRFEAERVPPIELLRDAEESFREIARTQGVELQIQDVEKSGNPRSNGSVEALPAVLADREAIHQVFSNLIDNAMKYGRSGGRIVLGARSAPRAIEFYVRDFGAGIPSEHLPRLFERFYRVDKARSRESGGTGLGLAIAKHIVRAHDGSIRAESELNHGATFLFTLPTG
jgi:two-component system, OmpR family, phosphate regulon sensor histidine kinase PhoR